jgi:hypothetical protein
VISKVTDSRLPPLKEFVGSSSSTTQLLAGRIGWEELVRVVASVYDDLPAEDRNVAGIYADVYPLAGAIDLYGPKYGLPHAVSGSLTYYLWGPGYSWDVMIIVVSKTNSMAMFFDECEQKSIAQGEENVTVFGHPRIFVCRKPKVTADKIWSSVESYR